MAGNSFGRIFTLTTFGESHGAAIGGVVDGCPAGLPVDYAWIKQQLAVRREDPLRINSRKENDEVVFLSGIWNDQTTGTPIGFMIPNQDVRSADYVQQAEVLRPSHADFVYRTKYGVYDYRGGGRASARETAARVVGGCFGKMFLRPYRMEILSFTLAIGSVSCADRWTELPLTEASSNALHCPDAKAAARMLEQLQDVASQGDTVGCVIGCIIKNVPVGLGMPVFDKLSADLAKAMLSINAAKGFAIGGGFDMASQRGSQVNDLFVRNGKTETNFSGGIQAGISNGEEIWFSVAFKPLPTLMREQQTVDMHNNKVLFQPAGRHDVCAAPRVRAVVEAMAALTMADHMLQYKSFTNEDNTGN
jgi:chorismate synthase